MLEMSFAYEYHCNPRRVARVNGKLIFDAAAGLNNCRNARFYTFFHAIGEREKRVACHYRALDLFARVRNRLLRRPNAVGLTHTDTRGSVRLQSKNLMR